MCRGKLIGRGLGQGDGRPQLGRRTRTFTLHLDVVSYLHGVPRWEAQHRRLLHLESQTCLSLPGKVGSPNEAPKGLLTH